MSNAGMTLVWKGIICGMTNEWVSSAFSDSKVTVKAAPEMPSGSSRSSRSQGSSPTVKVCVLLPSPRSIPSGAVSVKRCTGSPSVSSPVPLSEKRRRVPLMSASGTWSRMGVVCPSAKLLPGMRASTDS